MGKNLLSLRGSITKYKIHFCRNESYIQLHYFPSYLYEDMSTTQKTVKIFFPGDRTGTKMIELSSWNGIGYRIPRNVLKETLSLPEHCKHLSSPGVYLLVGEDENRQPMVYVGEAEKFSQRVMEHHQNKDFWSFAICFLGKDGNLTKAHVKYLEHILTKAIKEAARVKVMNGNTPPCPSLPLSDIAEMNEFLENIHTIFAATEVHYLDPIKAPENKDIYFCKGKGIQASGLFSSEGFFILEGSTICGTETPTIPAGVSATRKMLIQNLDMLKLLPDGNFEVLTPLQFQSPSYASDVVLGNSSNGWVSWKDKEGRTLDEVKRG